MAFIRKADKLGHAYFSLIIGVHVSTDVGHIRACTGHKAGVIRRTVGATSFYEIEASLHKILFGRRTAYLMYPTHGAN